MTDGYRHEALGYDGGRRGEAGFVEACAGVLRDGLDSTDRLIVLAGSDRLAAVSETLGADAEAVTFVPTDDHRRNPSRITGLLHKFQAAGEGRYCVGVNEVVFAGRSPAERAETAFVESLLNEAAVRSWPMSIVCLYDVSPGDAAAVTSMEQNHEYLRGLGANPRYRADAAAATFRGDLDRPPGAAARFVAHAPGLAAVREFVRGQAVRFGLAPDRVDDLILAADEVVTNSLRYGGGSADVAIWCTDGAAVCEVRDHGHVVDLFAGRFPPSPSATRGRGLWLANLLCDLVQVRSSEAGTTVRLHIDR